MNSNKESVNVVVSEGTLDLQGIGLIVSPLTITLQLVNEENKPLEFQFSRSSKEPCQIRFVNANERGRIYFVDHFKLLIQYDLKVYTRNIDILDENWTFRGYAGNSKTTSIINHFSSSGSTSTTIRGGISNSFIGLSTGSIVFK